MRATSYLVRKIFLRCSYLLVPYCLILVADGVFDAFRIKYYVEYNFLESMVMNMTEMTLYFSLAAYALFIYMGYELTVKARDRSSEENNKGITPRNGAF